jgi:hypothetical protein
MYLGSWKIDDLLTFYANTHRFDTGAATDADSVPSYRIYEDETGTAILTGSMALLDSSNTAGFYSEQITLSAANGFEKGKSYAVYISAAVNSVTGATHHTLQIEAEVDANTVSPTVVNANVTQLGGSSIDQSGGLINANVKQISTDATAADNAEAFFDGTGYAGTNNVIPLVTTVTNLTNAPTNGDLTTAMKASVNAEADTALADYDAPTHTELTAELATADDATLTAIAALNDITAADVWAAATRTLTAISDSAGITTLLSRIAGALNISGGKIESNVKQVNDVDLTGDGSGTPWGPA